MDCDMKAYTIPVGERYTNFISKQFKFIENQKIIEEGTLLNSTNNSLDPFAYHLAKIGEGGFKTMECNQMHSFYPKEEGENDEDEDIWRAQRELDACFDEQRNLDEPAYCKGNNQMVKIFNQKCVSCFGNPIVYAFRQCGHQGICEKYSENKGDTDTLKCINCRS